MFSADLCMFPLISLILNIITIEEYDLMRDNKPFF